MIFERSERYQSPVLTQLGFFYFQKASVQISALFGFIMILLIIGCNNDRPTPEPFSIEKSLEFTGPALQVINYEEIGKAIAEKDDDELMKKYVDFILKNHGSADELRSKGLGHIYLAHPLKVIKIIESKSASHQEVIIESLAFGLANIVGPKLEVYDQETAKIIQQKVLEILNDK